MKSINQNIWCRHMFWRLAKLCNQAFYISISGFRSQASWISRIGLAATARSRDLRREAEHWRQPWWNPFPSCSYCRYSMYHKAITEKNTARLTACHRKLFEFNRHRKLGYIGHITISSFDLNSWNHVIQCYEKFCEIAWLKCNLNAFRLII